MWLLDPLIDIIWYDIGWDLGFELKSSVGIVMGEPVEYPLEGLINTSLSLVLGNNFVTI